MTAEKGNREKKNKEGNKGSQRQFNPNNHAKLTSLMTAPVKKKWGRMKLYGRGERPGECSAVTDQSVPLCLQVS